MNKCEYQLFCFSVRVLSLLFKKYLLLLEREDEGEETLILLLIPFMLSLDAACMCPDLGSNLQPWCMGMTLPSANLPG